MTSPPPALLLPYRLEHTPATAAQPGGVALHRVRLTVGDSPGGRTTWPVRCRGITFDLPHAAGASATSGEPVVLRTRLDLPRGPGRGRQWLVETTTPDPAATFLTLTPADPALFDGTWVLALTLDISTPVGAETRVTEDTALGDDIPQRRVGNAHLTAARGTR
ncbi:hypothetical protein J0X20_28195 [Streptomyces sp. KCTC 0041BP]|uniref:hypothetical protein n=1 Tax=Streptomyces sp. KCTC 0041BP TaxID=201500 RepID=UPI001AE75829|nr:hypothetical protein [Streptomyces sp. KCTC 0041BP]MBP0937474.1 hypothetical protein [Streptomyces sp. KCTC 0041BP]